MKTKLIIYSFLTLIFVLFYSCKKKGCMDETATNYDATAEKEDGSCKYPDPIVEPTPSKLRLIFKFDSAQKRLDSFGKEVNVPTGHGAISPKFNQMAISFVELIENEFVQKNQGKILYKTFQKDLGGKNITLFDSLAFGGEGDEFFNINLSDVTPGTYKYIRISVAYQNYEIPFRGNGYDMTGTLASFVGDSTYINSFVIKDSTVNVNDYKIQGYWAFETNNTFGVPLPISVGQAPATTVPNPIDATSKNSVGSCLVTGEFTTPLVITDSETDDIIVECSFSVNKSFEWKDANGNNIYEPLDGDTVVDMGLRGLKPSIK